MKDESTNEAKEPVRVDEPLDKSELEGLCAFDADHEWIGQHYEELLREYEDEWVAVEGGRVIAHAPEWSGLKKQLADPANTCVEFITREPLDMIL
jgi:hypothetical protein